MSKIISIGTALPPYKHSQHDIQKFMELVFALEAKDNRKLRFLYHQSGIEYRYSVVPDYSREITQWKFYPRTENLEPFPNLENRMAIFNKHAACLSVNAIRNCLNGPIQNTEITHLITVSCTGMSAPGLDLEVIELMDLPRNIYRTSINFMGCYAAIHALKMADAICQNEKNAKVMIVCTELCTLHFQKEASVDNITSSLLFGDGAAAVLVTHDSAQEKGLRLGPFYSEIIPRGKKDMTWELSSSGFLMSLTSYVSNLLEEDFSQLVIKALEASGFKKEMINHWCIHPGGKRILDSIARSLEFRNGELTNCYSVLKEYGNMSSPTILFVLKKIMASSPKKDEKIFAASFGPGLTVETFVADCWL